MFRVINAQRSRPRQVSRFKRPRFASRPTNESQRRTEHAFNAVYVFLSRCCVARPSSFRRENGRRITRRRVVTALEFPTGSFLSVLLAPLQRLNTVQAVSRERQMRFRRSYEITLSYKEEQPAQNANKATDYSTAR